MPPVTAPTPAVSRRSSSLWRSEARRDQLFACLVGIILLAVSAYFSTLLKTSRTQWNLVRQDPESAKSLRSLAITFPRLTLGGFRGVVSAALWYQAEDDKGKRNWLDLETKYDIIGALQPYFVTVYIYHAWNQAYNISAHWQDYDTKYKWILDGMSYLYKGDDYNPGNPDLMKEEGYLYFLKFGSAWERIFFRQHWRDDLARLHELNGAGGGGGAGEAAKTDAGIALQHVRDIINRKDARDGRKYFNVEELPNPNRLAGPTGWGIKITDPHTDFNLFSGRTDNKKATDPVEFRYGVSVFYFAYIELKRCIDTGKVPSSTNMQFLDAWPAMSLRMWCRDDLFYIHQTMRDLFGPHPNADLLRNRDAFNAKAEEMGICFRNVQMIAPRAVDLFNQHLGRYPINRNIHPKHIMETQAYISISRAEYKLFQTLIQWHLNGRKLDNDTLINSFKEADRLYQEAYKPTMDWVDTMYPVVPGQTPNQYRADAEQYANNILARSKGIEALLTTPPGQQPDMSFLEDEVVER